MFKAALAAAVLFAAVPLHAAGLRTKLGRVRVRGLKIGQTYSLNKLLSLPLRVVNTGDQAEELKIEVVTVSSGTGDPSYEPIPDLSWVKLEKSQFTVAAGHEAVTDVFVGIPNDPKLLGRRFEVHLWSHTTSVHGIIAVGVKSKLFIEVSSVPPSEEELRKKFVERQVANVDFTLFPTEGLAADVPLGVDFDLKKERKLSIKLVNPNDFKLTFRIHAVPSWESLISAPNGFQDARDTAWVRASTDTVAVEGNSIKETAIIVNIPDREEFRGKAYFFGIAVEPLEAEIPVAAYYKLGVQTQQKTQSEKAVEKKER